MTLDKLLQYVILDVDDTDYTLGEISFWFNKGIAQYNLLAPITLYPFYTMDYSTQDPLDELALDLGYGDEYPLDTNFMLGIMLPYINSSVKAQEASLDEKYGYEQKFVSNAKVFKVASNAPLEYLQNKIQTDLARYQLGEGVYLSTMETAPFPGGWSTGTTIPTIDEE